MSESVYTMFPEIFSYNGRKVISLSFHRHKIFKNDPASERISDCEQSHFCHQSERSAVFRLCHVHWARGRFNSRIFVVDELQCCVPRLVMCLLQQRKKRSEGSRKFFGKNTMIRKRLLLMGSCAKHSLTKYITYILYHKAKEYLHI